MESSKHNKSYTKESIDSLNWPPETLKLIQQLENENFECKACKNFINKSSEIFTCPNCKNITHLNCLEYKQLTLKDDKKEFYKCKLCNERINTKPFYDCYCGKFYNTNPKALNTKLIPHGCGLQCNYNICKHNTCTLPCHPGQHELIKCKQIDTVFCNCGKNVIKVPCSEELILPPCNAKCGRPLQCGKHFCESGCHIYSCGECKQCDKAKVKSTIVINLKGKQNVYGTACEKDKDIVYCGRQNYMGGWELKKSIWANPFKVKDYGTNEAACQKYEEYVRKDTGLMKRLGELVGKKLACWCDPEPCHCHILIKLLKEEGLI
jgi:hypothetical protein